MNTITICSLVCFLFLIVACGDNESSSEQSKQTGGTLSIFESKGAIQCESSGQSLEESAQKLIDAGIDVLKSRCAYRNSISVIAMCGASTTEIIVHEIPVQSVASAEAIGFANTQSIDNEYTVFECS